MSPLYETLTSESLLALDRSVLESMRAKNEEELKKLDEKWVSIFSWICFLECSLVWGLSWRVQLKFWVFVNLFIILIIVELCIN